jgi:rubrerythrin
MNNFTREELEELWFFTELHKNKYRLKYPEELLNKIQSMINLYDTQVIPVWHCEKCGHVQ